jgi:hypothetical protein
MIILSNSRPARNERRMEKEETGGTAVSPKEGRPRVLSLPVTFQTCSTRPKGRNPSVRIIDPKVQQAIKIGKSYNIVTYLY